MLVTRPGPSPRQKVMAAAVTVMSTSGGCTPRYGIISQCTTTINTTEPVDIPISGIRSLRETLGLTRRAERATANAIKTLRLSGNLTVKLDEGSANGAEPSQQSMPSAV